MVKDLSVIGPFLFTKEINWLRIPKHGKNEEMKFQFTFLSFISEIHKFFCCAAEFNYPSKNINFLIEPLSL